MLISKPSPFLVPSTFKTADNLYFKFGLHIILHCFQVKLKLQRTHQRIESTPYFHLHCHCLGHAKEIGVKASTYPLLFCNLCQCGNTVSLRPISMQINRRSSIALQILEIFICSFSPLFLSSFLMAQSFHSYSRSDQIQKFFELPEGSNSFPSTQNVILKHGYSYNKNVIVKVMFSPRQQLSFFPQHRINQWWHILVISALRW